MACQAQELSAALERGHAHAPFQLVLSADRRAVGLMVRGRPGRAHVVRCSSAAHLYSAFDGRQSKKDSLRAHLELRSMRRADQVYAPSEFIAAYLTRTDNIDVRVLRPPAFLECQPAAQSAVTLPGRFFIHFGQLVERKGTSLLAEALPLAWQEVPDLTMVWTGRPRRLDKAFCLAITMGRAGGPVVITGALLKPDLYAVLRRAEAAVLPSQVDNLPNTVIESLMLGVPVLGSRGASIDELVEEGITGHLVALGSARELADGLIRMWRGRSPVRKGFTWDSAIAREMRPERALTNLLALAAGTTKAAHPSRAGSQPSRVG